jgi:hypothetical protein
LIARGDMSNSTLLKGMIKGMESMGATFVKNDECHLYFNVKKGSEIDNQTILNTARDMFQKSFNIGLKIRPID